MKARADKRMRSRRESPWKILFPYSPAILLCLLLIANLVSADFRQAIVFNFMLAVSAFLSAYLGRKFALTLTQQQQNIKLHESFFQKSPAIMFVKNLHGKYQLINNSFLEFLSASGLELTSMDSTQIFSQSITEQNQQVIQYKQAMEFQGKCPGINGNENQYFNILRFPLFDDAGEVVAIGGIANDRTDQLNARKALRESEEQFRALVESAPEAVLITDVNGKLLLANRQAESLFACSRNELKLKSLKDLLPGFRLSSYIKLHPAGTRNTAGQNLISMIAVDSDKLTKPVEVAFSITKSKDNVSITCLIRDMSDRARLETQLRQSQKMDAIGKLTGGMAHDFNNLLGVIMGNLDLATMELEKDSTAAKRLDTAKRAAERGADLTHRMLAVARRQPLQPKPVDIDITISEMADMLPRTLGPDIEMQYNAGKNIPNVLVDPSGLENAFLNLAINARDAMPKGGKFYITTDVLHLTEDSPLAHQEDMHPGSYVQIAVTDTGDGMTAETMSRVFEPFFTTKERGKGTGLGLAMIYGFTKQSGGNIQIYSEPGVGTTIDIFLPVSDEIALVSSSSQDNSPYLINNNHTEKVLVVDDKYELLEVTVSYLENMGFEVLAATDGKQALLSLQNNPDIEILLTDIAMPGGMSGVELAAEVREKFPAVKTLYMSGFPSGVIVDKSGVDLDAPLIIKPFSRTKLASALDELLQIVA